MFNRLKSFLKRKLKLRLLVAIFSVVRRRKRNIFYINNSNKKEKSNSLLFTFYLLRYLL